MIIYGAAGMVLLLFLIGPIRGRTLARLERVASGSVAFTISNRRVFGEALAVASFGTELGTRATSFTSEPCVTADVLGLTFWDNTPPQCVGSLDWSRVVSMRVGVLRTPLRRWTASAILLDVTAGEGIVVVPLLSPNGSRRFSGSRRESEWMLRLLEPLWAQRVTV